MAISICRTPTVIDRLQRALEFLRDIRLEAVADLDVVVAGELDATLEALLDFLHVVLHPLQRVDGQAFGDDLAVADQSNLVGSHDVAVGAHATGDVAQPADLEDLPNLDVAMDL